MRDSTIDLRERVTNKERKFGANQVYFPARIITTDGSETNALFTASQIRVATKRALSNPEDIPGKTLWERIFG